jgi:3-oxoacyl-[acyl-carrier-protein] synthase II
LRHRGLGDVPRVVVTGIGLVTGLNRAPALPPTSESYREATWRAVRSGACGIRVLDDEGRVGPGFLGCPTPLDVSGESDPVDALLVTAAKEAVEDAGLNRPDLDFDRGRAAALIGLSKGYVRNLTRAHHRIRAGERDDPSIGRTFLDGWPSGGAQRVASMFGLLGPTGSPIAACATGLVAVLQGMQLIRRGLCDVVFAGSADASLEPVLLGAFRNMRVLADASEGPASSVRPCDRNRSGFVVGEGGAVLILERAEHALARGAAPYAELAGGELGSDAYHVTDLDPDPTNLAGLIRRALDRSGLGAEEIDHVNLHGTATRSNDPLECRALRLALGSHADAVSCTANKAQVGHLLGAAGAAELAITCLAIRDGFVPPTLNLEDPDPACDLDATPFVGRARTIRAALKLSLGFGGHLAAVVLRRPDGPRREPGDPGQADSPG